MAYIYKKCPITKEELTELVMKNTSRKTAKILGVATKSVSDWIKDFSIVAPRIASAKYLNLTQEQQDILYGSVLGDGCLAKCKETVYFTETHGNTQYEYLKWKADKLSDIMGNSFQAIADGRYVIRTKTNLHLTKLREEFYPNNGKKIVPKSLFDRLNPLILAVWIMDDGYLTPQGAYDLYTNGFTYEDHVYMKEVFKAKFDLDVVIRNKYDRNYDKTYNFTYFLKESSTRLAELISPYFVECMKYKLPC